MRLPLKMLVRAYHLLTLFILSIFTYTLTVGCGAFVQLASKDVATTDRHLQMGCSYDWASGWSWAVAQEKQIFAANGANIEKFTKGVHIFSPEENLATFTPGDNLEHLPYTVQKVADFLIKVAQIAQPPDLDKLLDDRFVRAYGNSKTARS